MGNKFSKEVILLLKKNLRQYKEWIKPKPADPLGLTIVKSFFKGIASIILIAFSPIVLVILLIAFLAAF